MGNYNFQVVMQRRQDGTYVADVPALPGCHAEGRTIQELLENVREKVSLHLQQMQQTHADFPLAKVSAYVMPDMSGRVN